MGNLHRMEEDVLSYAPCVGPHYASDCCPMSIAVIVRIVSERGIALVDSVAEFCVCGANSRVDDISMYTIARRGVTVILGKTPAALIDTIKAPGGVFLNGR